MTLKNKPIINPPQNKYVKLLNIMIKKLLTSASLIILTFILIGCGETETNPDARDEKHPLVQKALKQIEAKQFILAANTLEEALATDSKLVRPHLEIARIYHQIPETRNYANAIYHYNQYLSKRPETAKTEVIRNWITQAELNYASEILRTNPNDFMAEVNRLKRENASLKQQVTQQIAQLRGNGQMVPPAPIQPTIAPTPIAPAKPVAVAKTNTNSKELKTYTVKKGDTLSKISRTMYGTTVKWNLIYEANRGKMKNERDLKIGQSLVIPQTNEDRSPRG